MKIQEIEANYLSLYCEGVLGSPLVESDSHDMPDDGETLPPPMMTKNKEFYFVPDYTDPVMKQRRGLSLSTTPEVAPEPIPGRYHYTIEVVKCYSGGMWEPDDFDLAEIGKVDSINAAIDFAAHAQLDWKLQSIGESLYYQKENELAPFIEDYRKNN